jgi:exonuclease SbcC
MILKSLHLKNIRSNKDQVIEFPLGTTLFEGDIGSGKSTLLMAIEFTLFGLGSERGAALLRTGEKQGLVDLKFEIDGEEYEIHRSLIRKGKAVQQEKGYIKTKEGILELSPTELKEKVLEILNFNEPPNPNAQSVIYRYAVFTPQEEMKAILWMPEDARLQTLRKAFRIEDYRIAMENATALAKIIDDKINAFTTLAADLEIKISDKKEKEEEIRVDEKSLQQLDKDKIGLEEELRKHREYLAKLRSQEKKLSQAVGEVPHLEKGIKEKTKEIADLKVEIEKFSKELEELLPTIEKLQAIKQPTTRTEEELKKELEGLRKLDKKLRKNGATIDAKIADYESIEKNKVCPTCDRPADPEEFKGKIEQKLQEKKRAEAEINQCEEKIKSVEELQDKLREYVRAQEKLQELNKQVKRNREEIEKNKGKITILVGQVEEAKKRLAIAQKDVEELEKVSAKVVELDKEVEKVEKALGKTRKKLHQQLKEFYS